MYGDLENFKISNRGGKYCGYDVMFECQGLNQIPDTFIAQFNREYGAYQLLFVKFFHKIHPYFWFKLSTSILKRIIVIERVFRYNSKNH